MTDTTMESLILILRDNPRGLILTQDELSGWFRSFDRYRRGRGGDCAYWLSMWGAEPLTVDRKTAERSIHVPRAAVSITGTIQP